MEKPVAKYWWVNHNQTHRKEVSGGYVWSPKSESNGARSHYYDNMRRVSPGDFILSMADAKVAYVGCATDYAISAPKPEEFGQAGSYWSHDGWLLPVAWQRLSRPIRPKDRIIELAPLLRGRYAPIQAETGNGNQKAYLCEIDSDLFRVVVMIAETSNLVSLKDRLREHAPGEAGRALEEAVSSQIDRDPTLSSTEKTQLQRARIGQGKFRANVFAVEHCCRVTGIDNPELLIASHIRPWRSCENALQRLDGHNGLLLTPHVDLLFDRGLISFLDSGTVIVSPRASPLDIDKLGLAERLATRLGDFVDAQKEYLAYHRENVLLV